MLNGKLLPGIAAIVVLAAGCGNNDEVATNGSDGAADAPGRVTNVEVMEIVPRPFEEYIRVSGTVKAGAFATVSAEEAGVVERFERDKGDAVSAGDVVVRLRSDLLTASFQEAEAAYKLAEATAKRQENLFAQRSISEQQYLNAKYNRDMAKARLEQLAARLARTVIRSPISGLVDSRFVEQGEYVGPGTPLFTVVDVDTVKIEAGIPERYIPDLRKGTSAEITFDVYPDKVFKGRIRFVGASIDPRNRTFPTEIVLPNPEHLIKPEMLARLRILRRRLENAIVVPLDAVIERDGKAQVFVARGEIAQRREVAIGPAEGDQVVLLSGVAPGDLLIVVGHRDLTDGERIRVLAQRDG
jgi:membrane fusion protein (multidrug efflux system)